ncbi:hypothetical protein LYSBPC_28170 [Lysinibacillus piscis]|uniref:Uncharacterized protein n=1 Tax=Lysinibacillus piscis TaxID=2518931 RepID=A0ABQ5NN72_9BACI|nr:hypothetical protein LYSBPC_28170 [Lysinibacillus sp. KH24]
MKGIKTNWQHEFLSDLERNNFYLTEYSDFILNIREQFPLLSLEETIVIADKLGIKHSIKPTKMVAGVTDSVRALIIVDIREQYPFLLLEEPSLIAEELGITHPRNPKTNESIIMTTDFVVTLQDKEIWKSIMKKSLFNELKEINYDEN